MAVTVQCEIVSGEDSIFSGRVEFISATGSLGELGVTPGHTPLLTELKPGPIELRKEGGELDIFFASGGFIEVQPYKVTVLADTALRAKDIDEAAAMDAQKHAREAIADKNTEFEFTRAAAQLAEAAAQLHTLQQIRKKLGN